MFHVSMRMLQLHPGGGNRAGGVVKISSPYRLLPLLLREEVEEGGEGRGK